MLEKYAKHIKKSHGKVDWDKLPLVRPCLLWAIVENEYPYDQIALVHHLLVPTRSFASAKDMEAEELWELDRIKDEIAETREYDVIMENIPHRRTAPGHYHLHLIKYKEITDMPLQSNL